MIEKILLSLFRRKTVLIICFHDYEFVASDRITVIWSKKIKEYYLRYSNDIFTLMN
jgi:hypothetical protein